MLGIFWTRSKSLLRYSFIFFLTGLLYVDPSWSVTHQSSHHSIAVERILQDIRELSHPRYAGRQTGTEGGRQSANFVLNRFAALGLKPGESGSADERSSVWTQQQPVHALKLSPRASMVLSGVNPTQTVRPVELQPGKDFLPILDSLSSKTRGRVMFAGYGIVDHARGIDHYHGIDVHNRLVLFLRGKPPSYKEWVTHEEKVTIAKERGALGYLTATGPLLSHYEALKGLGQRPLAIYSALPEDNPPIPGAWVNGETLDRFLRLGDFSLEKLQQSANDSNRFQGRPLPILGDLQWESQTESGMLTNVIGIVEGRDPKLQNEVILIGAHRDHFGHQAGLLFPGADDNASGTAVLLELARMLSERPLPPKRTVLFISFDGEERGLWGSTYYVNHPTLSLKRTKAMVNLDHLGVGDGKLTVGVTRLDKLVVQRAAEAVALSDQIQIYGYFPGGDHVPFYDAEVPTITIVSSGQHANFHQPSDTIDFLQPEILETSTKFLFSLMTYLADHPQIRSDPKIAE